MRKVFLATLALFFLLDALVVGRLFIDTRKSGEAATYEGVVLSENTGAKTTDISLGGREYKVVWASVDTDELSLLANFDDKKTSRQVFQENHCGLLVNGGFYSKDSQPMGYFVSAGQTLNPYERNRLLNGVLSINELGTPRITREPPRDPLVNAVQTGPILIENGQILGVSEMNNKAARRMVAAVTGNNELLFLAIYSSESAFSGPLLSELPQVVAKFDESDELGIADAVNLDGGSASAFVTTNFSLSEASPVGSFFCAR